MQQTESTQGEEIPKSFPALVVRRDGQGKIDRRVDSVTLDDLPPGDVLIRVEYSSLNYKDALAAEGHPGVARSLPHVPGIDAAGHVVEIQGGTADSSLHVGMPVIVTGYELGAGRWGGWSRYIRVPSEWVVPLPDGLTLREAMILGTAGFTAAQCVRRLRINDVEPASGKILVTGSTGGVGSLAVAILSQLGYRVTASTGKASATDWLRSLGAAEVVSREEVVPVSDKPLLSARWAGAVDTVGGATLAAVLKQVDVFGCVAACGLVAGAELSTTVYPFILRGVQLAGITSALCPRSIRLELWQHLAGPWKPPQLERVVRETTLAELSEWIEQILQGKIQGRVVVRLADE